MLKPPNPKLLAAAIPLAVTLLMGVEGLSTTTYSDIAGVLTDCYGNTKDVVAGHRSTKAECQTKLAVETGRIAKMIATDDANHANRMTPGNLVGMTSWTYNVGDGAYRGSTARKNMLAGNYTAMCQNLAAWKYVTIAGVKVVSPGLQNRRDKEIKACLS